jgi:hypothetical protein
MAILTDKPHKTWEARIIKACDSCPPDTFDVYTEYKTDGSRIENAYGTYGKFQTIYDKDGNTVSTKVTDYP